MSFITSRHTIASGRRAIEVLLTGAFEAVGEYTVRFSGQAKKQTGVETDAYDIYTLIPASEFIRPPPFDATKRI